MDDAGNAVFEYSLVNIFQSFKLKSPALVIPPVREKPVEYGKIQPPSSTNTVITLFTLSFIMRKLVCQQDGTVSLWWLGCFQDTIDSAMGDKLFVHQIKRREDMANDRLKKVLAGVSMATLIAGAGLTFTGCATTSCSGNTSCSGMQKEGSQTSCSGKTSCSGGSGEKTGCGCKSGCSGKK